MLEYCKINTVFKRDAKKNIIPGQWSLDEFDYLQDNPWRWTEKVDGTNTRLHWTAATGAVSVGGRTDAANIPAYLLDALAPYLKPELWQDAFAGRGIDGVTVYGEGYGPKIQSGSHYHPTEHSFVVFDVRIGDWWLRPSDVAGVAGKLGMRIVPEVGVFTLNEAVALVRGGALQSAWNGAHMEGLVGTPTVPLYSRKGDRIMAKVKGRDFARLAQEKRGMPYADA